MYSAQYFFFLARQYFPKEQHSTLEKLSKLIPENGILETSFSELAGQLNISEKALSDILEKLTKTKVPLAAREKDRYIFDYDPGEVEKARHFQNALSNTGLLRDDF